MNNTYAANATWTTCHVCQSSITDLWNITSSRLCHFLHLQTGRALFFFFFFGKHYYFWYLSSSNCLNTWKYNARQQEKLRVQPCLVCWSQARLTRAWVWGGKYWVMHIPGFGIVWGSEHVTYIWARLDALLPTKTPQWQYTFFQYKLIGCIGVVGLHDFKL